ncbi:DUF2586 family protein [Brevibacillus centrosporus]|uniref:Phage tail sheath protein n=1 Tax=Brevibacillus centrosporus TaxID=54910 RepID=A0A1I3LZ32_9BACL|nr:DUF2586 family protein [Brevibacillus centrosporus]SFI90039.1 Protein of unknown function [Brevibacillus centrosporus]
MSIPDINVNLEDGGLGVVPPNSTGLHVKIGVAAAGPESEIIAISGPSSAKQFGKGPLVRALSDAFAEGTSNMYVIRATADIDGTVSAVEKTGTGTGSVSVSGKPTDEIQVELQIVTSGGLNQATFTLAIDGQAPTAPITVPITGSYELPDSGLTITFTPAGDTPENSFKANDKYAFSATAPQMSTTSLVNALDLVLESEYPYEFIHIVGPSTPAVWTLFDSKLAAVQEDGKFVFGICETRDINKGETIDQYVKAMLDQAANFSSILVSVVTSGISKADFLNGKEDERNPAGIIVGRVAQIPVHRSAGRVLDGALSATELRPAGIKKAHIIALDNARYTTVRRYDGIQGIYCTNFRMMAPTGSDYLYGERTRVMLKAARLVRAAALLQEQNEIPFDDATGNIDFTPMENLLTAALNPMLNAEEITKARVVIKPEQNILAGEPMKAVIRITPRGAYRDMELEIGFENPFGGAN